MAVQIAIYRKERSALIDHNISMIDYKPKWKKSQEWQKKHKKVPFLSVVRCPPMGVLVVCKLKFALHPHRLSTKRKEKLQRVADMNSGKNPLQFVFIVLFRQVLFVLVALSLCDAPTLFLWCVAFLSVA